MILNASGVGGGECVFVGGGGGRWSHLFFKGKQNNWVYKA